MSSHSEKHSEAMKAFLRELSELTERYGFYIDGPDYGGGPLVVGNRENVDIYYDHREERYGVI
jgi:hypothetical protein